MKRMNIRMSNTLSAERRRLAACERIIRYHLCYVLIRCTRYTNSRSEAERILFYTFVTACSLAAELQNVWQLWRLIDEMVDVVGEDVQKNRSQSEADHMGQISELLLADDRIRQVARAANTLDGFTLELLVLGHLEIMSAEVISQVYNKSISEISLQIERGEHKLAAGLAGLWAEPAKLTAENVHFWLEELAEALHFDGVDWVTELILRCLAESEQQSRAPDANLAYWHLN